MNGPQDMGGLQGYGPVIPEKNEPVFHGEWEEKALALTLAMGFFGQWNIDIGRHARESLPPANYIAWSYYEIWLAALENLLVEHGFITSEELDKGKADAARKDVGPAVRADAVERILSGGSPYEREITSPARFKAGDKVHTLNMHPTGHTRLPRYARGKTGEVLFVNGAHVYPDTHAHGEGEQPQWLYTVQFSARELWGDQARAGDTITVDCWEPYLEPA